MNNFKLLQCSVLCCIAIAGLTGCGNQDDPTLKPDEPTIGGHHTAVMNLNVTRSHYADEDMTRSASEWQNGDKIYLTFTAESVKTHGEAIYKDGIWTVDYYGTLTQGEGNTCTAVYFENALFDHGSVVTINETTGIYEDLEGSYTLKDGELTVTASLRPKTGRIRFKGASEEVLTVNGITHYTAYDASIGKYSTTTGSVQAKVDSEYTEYIYGYFGEADNRRLNLVTTESAYTRMVAEGVYEAGESGFMSIPTASHYDGWQNYAIFKAEGVEFKMIPVKYSEGNFLLAETETTRKFFSCVTQKRDTEPMDPKTDTIKDWEEFIGLLHTQLNLDFRFPTTAEWQYAFIGGENSQGYTYSGSDNIDEVARYNLNMPSGWASVHGVKSFKPNELGFYDMSGNVWEFTLEPDGSYVSYGGNSSSNAEKCSTQFIKNTGDWNGLRLALSVNKKAGENAE